MHWTDDIKLIKNYSWKMFFGDLFTILLTAFIISLVLAGFFFGE